MRLTIDESQISSKQKNKARILRILGEKGLLTRRNLAHEINLTPAAITNLTSDLIKENYVYEKGTLPSKKGKTGPRSINLDLTIDSVWILGVHIKFKMIEIASVNLKGE